MPKIALNFEDGVTKIINALPYEKVSDAAYREGINIPLDCADGACGTCKCKVKAGEFDPGDYIDEALSEEEAAEGFGLACQIVPETDIIVEILASSAACKVVAETYASTITAVNYLSAEIVQLKVQLPEAKQIEFLAGQYANIEVPGSEETRSYSFTNKSNENELEFLIRLIPDGLMSNFLRDVAKVGETLNITAPIGSFYVRTLENPTLLIAGGTGIAPIISMLEGISISDNKQPITVIYGATTDENLVEIERIKAFASTQNITLELCVSNQEDSSFTKGYATQWINKEYLTSSTYDVYICGPNAMVDAVKQAIETNQINVDNFYTEKFVPTGSVTV